MTQAMLGVSHTTKEGEEFALKVMHHLNNTCQKWKKKQVLDLDYMVLREKV